VHTKIGAVIIGALCLAAVGCASPSPSRELVAARTAYDEAYEGDAARLAPTRVYEARKALVKAERAFDDDPGSIRERQLSYIALRLSEVAMAEARYMRAKQDLAAQNQRFQDIRRTAAQQEVDALERDLAMKEAQLEMEKAGRKGAETEAELYQRILQELAKLKAGEQGITLSLSGAVLFAFGKSDLLPAAQRVLDEVAKALKEQETQRTITVEGHTDSVGTVEFNQILSKQRAEAVRSFLVSKGVDPGRIKAVGKGKASPVAENDTPEGRAQNRRVEIIVSERVAMPQSE
jgi:outer membrane protein OmpA-like peptidoglycan-associated protein